MGNELARKITKWMATWTFIFLILLICVSEIAANHYGIVHFDPTMLVLNTILSLWAAVQGSIIMINQNQQDKATEALLQHIYQISIAQKKGEVKRDKMLRALVSLEETLNGQIQTNAIKIDEILKTLKQTTQQ